MGYPEILEGTAWALTGWAFLTFVSLIVNWKRL